jgi:hypothetical protein
VTDQMQEMTKEEVRQFLAGRKEAGKTIDVENCEFTWCWGEILDPYGVHSWPPEEYQVGRIYFVRSLESGGWVSHYDLPPAILKAFYEALPNLISRWSRCCKKRSMPIGPTLTRCDTHPHRR